MHYGVCVANIYRCAWRSTWFDGVEVVNTFHVQTDVGFGGSEPDIADVADDLDDALRTKYKALIWDSSTLDDFTLTEELADGDSSIPAQHVISIAAAGTHNPSDETAPTEICALLQLRTAVASRSARGRMFLPPCVNALYYVRDAWAAGGQLTAITTFADELISTHNVGSTDVNTVIYSKTRRDRTEDPFTFKVTSWARDARPHWLRSRSSAP